MLTVGCLSTGCRRWRGRRRVRIPRVPAAPGSDGPVGPPRRSGRPVRAAAGCGGRRQPAAAGSGRPVGPTAGCQRSGAPAAGRQGTPGDGSRPAGPRLEAAPCRGRPDQAVPGGWRGRVPAAAGRTQGELPLGCGRPLSVQPSSELTGPSGSLHLSRSDQSPGPRESPESDHSSWSHEPPRLSRLPGSDKPPWPGQPPRLVQSPACYVEPQ